MGVKICFLTRSGEVSGLVPDGEPNIDYENCGWVNDECNTFSYFLNGDAPGRIKKYPKTFFFPPATMAGMTVYEIYSYYRNAMHSEGITHIKKNPVALDKALYYFCEVDTEVKFVWLFEDDCMFGSRGALSGLVEKYSFAGHDLVITSHKKKTDKVLDWHWKNVFSEFPEYQNNFHHSMAPAVGLSRRMLNAIKATAHAHKKLFYHEIMFNTLAAACGFNICTPPELRTCVWQGEWGIDDIMKLPTHIFHPKKERDQHERIRQLIEMAKVFGYRPVDKLPNFVKYSEEELY